jgi:hypothetical protein
MQNSPHSPAFLSLEFLEINRPRSSVKPASIVVRPRTLMAPVVSAHERRRKTGSVQTRTDHHRRLQIWRAACTLRSRRQRRDRGALVQWLRDNLGLLSTSADVETLARTVKDNGGVYIVPAFSGLFAPYWQSSARGVIVGLTRYANKGHLARAALEATAYQTREVLEAMELDMKTKIDVLRTDGGMVVDDLLMQFQADILGAMSFDR